MEKNNGLTELQLKHQQQMKEKRDTIRERKARTHRLIVRGAIAEKAIEGAESMTDEQFQQALLKAIGKKSDDIAPSHPQVSSLGRVRRKTPAVATLGRAHHHDFRRDV